MAYQPSGNYLVLGSGLGLSLSWISDGMDETSKVISVDNDSKLTDLVTGFFQNNKNVFIFCADGGEWIEKYEGEKFDLIFADAWPGKFERLKETLDLLKIGGFYVIDDLEPQPNWPEAHQQKVEDLLKTLEARIDLVLTKVNWSTGLILATKK
ncbi:MAG: SAM-dependent methyltransferase [Cyclobacteriaceae bacterium]|nr:SAM-dependent methyltransferase [Cyclobacteriaceae bacterium]